MNKVDLNKYSMYFVVGEEKGKSGNFSFHISLKDKYLVPQKAVQDSMALSTIAAANGIECTTKIVATNASRKDKHEVQKIKRLATSDTIANVLKHLGFQNRDIDQIAAVINSAHVELNDAEYKMLIGRKNDNAR